MAPRLVIRLRDIHKSYGTGNAKTPVLRGVSLDIAAGEIVALVGQSGSGKSTLLNIIGGLDTAEGGSVQVLGRDYAETSEKDQAAIRNKELGFVFQAFNLLDHLTCLRNVTLPEAFATGGADADERGLAALERVGLSDFSMRTPAELSGGQKQRVAIARALFNNPKVLLCDEPTGNLDSDTGRQVIEFFKELNQKDGVTLLVVTHEERVSEAASRVITIEDGVIIDGVATLEDQADAQTADAKTTDAQTADAKTTDAKQADAKTTDAKTTDAKTADAKTTDAKTTDAKKADAVQTDAKKADAKKADAVPADEGAKAEDAEPVEKSSKKKKKKAGAAQ